MSDRFDDDELDPEAPEPIDRALWDALQKDIKALADLITPGQVRTLVDLYYEIQDFRKATGNQQRALKQVGEPTAVIGWAFARMGQVEHEIKTLMARYTDIEKTGMGAWAKQVTGIGPIISAGLLAHININQVRTAGQIWRLAGLDPTSKWWSREEARSLVENCLHGGKRITPAVMHAVAVATGRREESLDRWARSYGKGTLIATALAKAVSRRPWDAGLKVICYKLGESFVKFSNHPNCWYGHQYKARKEAEITRNECGKNTEAATQILATKKIGKETEAYKAYSQGKLPPAHVHARARRWTAKLFLAHWFEAAYRRHHGTEPPLPYPIAHIPGHTHRLTPPA